MFTKIIQSTALVLASALAAVPAVSQATVTQATAPMHATYETTIETIYGPSVPWSGTLDLTFNPSGFIQGYYHPADNIGEFVTVTGGFTGERVWMDIGRSGRLHVTGVLENGVITGNAFDYSTQQQFKFSAKLAH